MEKEKSVIRFTDYVYKTGFLEPHWQLVSLRTFNIPGLTP